MSEWSSTEMAEVMALVRRRSGLVFPAGRREEVERLARAAGVGLGALTPGALWERLRHDVALLDELVVDLTVGETYFFRHVDHFDLLAEEVLPEILARYDRERPLRVWSAGCATGEETYSLAMLLDGAGVLGRAYVVGTDVSQPALLKARRGIYRPRSVRLDGGDRARAYLLSEPTADGSLHRVPERIRARTVFRALNLKAGKYPSVESGVHTMDLIFCRNVLIYFDSDTIALVAQQLYDSLAEGGWLFTGPSDPLLDTMAPWAMKITARGVFYRRPFAAAVLAIPAPIAPQPSSGPMRRVLAAVPRPQVVAPPVAPAATGSLDDIRRQTRAQGGVVAARTLGAALVRTPLDAELHYLNAVAQLDCGRPDDALAACRRHLYLDGDSAAGYLLAGTLLALRGDLTGARRAMERARDLLAALPADAAVRYTEGESAASLAAAATAELAALVRPKGAHVR